MGGLLRVRAAQRGRRPRTPQTKLHAIERARRRRSFVRSFRFNHHFSYSNPTAHFPSPAYGEARDGALATAPRGGNGGGAFSPFSDLGVIVRGGRFGGQILQLGGDASQEVRRRLLSELVMSEAASNMARAGRGAVA